jgi:CRP/FNR family transcriptional regulator, cyclic AMP receptor protein
LILAIYTEEIYVADGATLLRIDPIGLLYVATVLAQRLDSANQTLLELKRQIQTREPRDVIGKTAAKMEMLLGASGAHLSL